MLPTATTTAGSFNVSAIAMATVVRSAANLGLAVVGQVHTHPRQAFHSEGDFDGMRIRYPGYVSIVLPNYGRLFPKWTGAEILMCAGPHDYFEIDSASLVEVNGDCS
jgi:proteasome lid subunit RPN8/RPN11